MLHERTTTCDPKAGRRETEAGRQAAEGTGWSVAAACSFPVGSARTTGLPRSAGRGLQLDLDMLGVTDDWRVAPVSGLGVGGIQEHRKGRRGYSGYTGCPGGVTILGLGPRTAGLRRDWRLWCAWGPVGTGALLQTGVLFMERRGGLTGRRRGRWGAGIWGLGAPGPRSSPLPCSIHNGVIAVFQRKGLPDQELFGLNEGVR